MTKAFAYVTYRKTVTVPTAIGIPGIKKVSRAIECPGEQELKECLMELSSMAALDFVRANRCGKLLKQTEVIPWEQYKQGKI